MAVQHPSGRAGRTGHLALISALFIILVIGVFAAGCGGTTTKTTAGGAAGGQVVMKNFAFDPASVTVKVGESVTWTNNDTATHTVDADNGEFSSGDLAQGASFPFKFDKTGTYPYHCKVHPNMKGTVVVQ